MVQKWPFFQLFFLGNIGQERVFYYLLARIHAFLGYKSNQFKKSTNCDFSKGVNPWFWSKNGHFSDFFFSGNIGQENVFYDILEGKTTFYAIKTRSSKSRNIDILPKGVTHVLVQKWPFFQLFFFRWYRPGKCL